GALGGGAGRGRLPEPARSVEASPGAARGRPRRGPGRRPAALVPGARRAPRRDRRVARAVPAVLDRPPRRPGTTPRRPGGGDPQGGGVMGTNATNETIPDDGTARMIDGRDGRRFERR